MVAVFCRAIILSICTNSVLSVGYTWTSKDSDLVDLEIPPSQACEPLDQGQRVASEEGLGNRERQRILTFGASRRHH